MRRVNLLLMLALLSALATHFVSAACNNDGTCDIGETNQFPPCYDCNNPICGNSYCDKGIGEHLYGQSTYCQADCGSPNGEACNANGQCVSNQCCGAPDGVCVETISCQPGETSVCDYDRPKITTCTNICSWGDCIDVGCVDDADCDDNNVCTTDECSMHPDYTCNHEDRQEWQCQSNPEKRCNYDSPPKCWELCVSPDQCLESQPANTIELDKFCQSPKKCYQCPQGYVWSGNTCIRECTSQCSSGQTQCPSTTQNRTCAYINNCWVWGSPQNCTEGTTCTQGSCQFTWTDECTKGNKRCQTNPERTETCGVSFRDRTGTTKRCSTNGGNRTDVNAQFRLASSELCSGNGDSGDESRLPGTQAGGSRGLLAGGTQCRDGGGLAATMVFHDGAGTCTAGACTWNPSPEIERCRSLGDAVRHPLHWIQHVDTSPAHHGRAPRPPPRPHILAAGELSATLPAHCSAASSASQFCQRVDNSGCSNRRASSPTRGCEVVEIQLASTLPQDSADVLLVPGAPGDELHEDQVLRRGHPHHRPRQANRHRPVDGLPLERQQPEDAVHPHLLSHCSGRIRVSRAKTRGSGTMGTNSPPRSASSCGQRSSSAQTVTPTCSVARGTPQTALARPPMSI